MGLGMWLRRLFSSRDPDDASAEREEYGLRDEGKADLDNPRFGTRFAGAEGAEAAEDDLASFEAPRDPNP